MATKRKPNWSSAETACLVDAFTSQASVLEGRFGPKLTSDTKEKLWRDVCERVNSIGLNERTIDEIQKKWNDLKSQTKKKEQVRRRHLSTTGGGEPAPNLSVWEEKIVSIIPTQSLIGIEGRQDVFQKNQQKDKTITQTWFGDEVLIHPVDVHVQVLGEERPNESGSVDEKKEEKDESPKDYQAKNQSKKRKPYDELVYLQIDYFKQAKITSKAKEIFFKEATGFIKKIKIPEDLKQPSCTEE